MGNCFGQIGLVFVPGIVAPRARIFSVLKEVINLMTWGKPQTSRFAPGLPQETSQGWSDVEKFNQSLKEPKALEEKDFQKS